MHRHVIASIALVAAAAVLALAPVTARAAGEAQVATCSIVQATLMVELRCEQVTPVSAAPDHRGSAIVHPGAGQPWTTPAGSAPAWRWSDADSTWSEQVVRAGAVVFLSPWTSDFTWAYHAHEGWLAMRTTDLATFAPPAATDARFRSDGRFLRDRHGRVVFLHGMNVVWKHAPYLPPSTLYGASRAASRFDERDARLLAENGFNGVRLGLTFGGVMPRRGEVDAQYLARARTLVDMLGAHGVGTIVDFHQDMYAERHGGEGFPSWATTRTGATAAALRRFPTGYMSPGTSGEFDDLWRDRTGLWVPYGDAWEATARRLADAPNVIGFDVINEPWPGGAWPTCLSPGGCTFDERYLQPFQEYAIGRLRAGGAAQVAFWEPNVLATVGVPSRIGAQRPLVDPAANTGASFHTYCALGGMVPGVTRAADPTCPHLERRTVRLQLEAAQRNGSVGMITEFGASDDLVDVGRVADLADRQMTSWFYWQYGGWSDPTGNAAEQGLFRDDGDRPGSLKAAKMRVLSRTYPQAVAGRPIGFRFHADRADRLFWLSYDADASIAAPTIVFVPVARHYPHGYRVRLGGPARVVSRAGASRLVLATTGSGRVVVSIDRR